MEALNSPAPAKFIHLLYAPTNFCNMGCQYCYLGKGTDENTDTRAALDTLKFAVGEFLAAGVTPFNLSFHGGEATAVPRPVLRDLFEFTRDYYAEHGPSIKVAGYTLTPLHIKTNLYNFDNLYDLFDEFEVSVSGSVDLPLALHAKYRTDKRGNSTLPRISKNLKLLAGYPHHKKISCVVTREHLGRLDEFVADIRYIHEDIGLDMTKFNIMFSFDSAKSIEKFAGHVPGTEMLSEEEQLILYNRLHEEFTGTDLEAGLRDHWFKEFTPEFCCSAVNCGDKFFLLQSNGDVYACPRGQSSRSFHYGNVFELPVTEVMANGWKTIEALENTQAGNEECYSCNYLPHCHQGCVFVREETGLTKSYTCSLQKAIYRDQPEKYPAFDDEYIKAYSLRYRFNNNIQAINVMDVSDSNDSFVTPELHEEQNSLAALINKDPVLTALYSPDNFAIRIDGEDHALTSPILNNVQQLALLTPDSKAQLLVARDVFTVNCSEPVTNTLHLMLLRNTMVTYGDEARTKQEHIVDYSVYAQTVSAVSQEEGDYLVFDLSAFFAQHQALFLKDVRNNLYVTTRRLREYHYQKQQQNAFYHIQAINLPFPYLEFYWAR